MGPSHTVECSQLACTSATLSIIRFMSHLLRSQSPQSLTCLAFCYARLGALNYEVGRELPYLAFALGAGIIPAGSIFYFVRSSDVDDLVIVSRAMEAAGITVKHQQGA
ncbi:unnamed protein product [Dibothriocephalus latus]|uniref:Uncharacterized protein n=1 Tax=Dibothriocephalus latus TaxID=60516 RepID=A0A3P7LY96_DIBLA|nr:unnamed protein product [Dibothriocephalus latus]